MKRIVWFTFVILLLSCYSGSAQDEGVIAKKARVVSKANTVYLTLGPAFRFAGNSSDYSSGLYVDAGFLKRFNRIVSLGPFVSFAKFSYDNSYSDSFQNADAKGNNIFVEDGGYEIRIVDMQGGDLKFTSIGADVRFDFIPSERIDKFSVYGIARPFFLISSRSKVTGSSEIWYRDETTDEDPSTWYYSGPPDEPLDMEQLNAETEFTGGISAGLGGAWNLPSGLSFSLQSLVVFTFPITSINTSSFQPTLDDFGFYHPEYPFVKKSFVSINICFGVSYTF